VDENRSILRHIMKTFQTTSRKGKILKMSRKITKMACEGPLVKDASYFSKADLDPRTHQNSFYRILREF
jgi:hypothetical protein